MSDVHQIVNQGCASGAHPYAPLSILELIELVAYEADPAARIELHQRQPCRHNGDFISITEWITVCSDQARRQWRDDLVVERASELTFEKFWRLPGDEDHGAGGTDSSKYFAAVATHCRKHVPQADTLERELMVAEALRSFIARHFAFSLREAFRQRKRRREAEYAATSQKDTGVGQGELGLPWPVEHGLEVHGLADVVAREKAANLEAQRPAIRVLGATRLAALVHLVFEQLAADELNLAHVAERFGVNRATMTRFAGIRWQRGLAGVPDLWANTAQVLGHSERFVAAAHAAGVWPGVQQALQGEGGREHA